ncbi:MAG: DUF1295 domain-containing protein [Neomegalonema sp.]|nr:DUF1295 domain-containing protein [Neomegalonema sp.]
MMLQPYLITLIAALCWFLLLWPLSLARRDVSLVDLVWAPGFAIIALMAWAMNGAPDDPRSLTLLGLIGAWSLRLGALMIGRKWHEWSLPIPDREDPRYQDLRAAWEPGFWWKSALLVFALQAVIQWALTLPLQSALAAPQARFGWLEIIGLSLAVCGLILESLSDWQLSRFKQQHGHRALMRSGLWSLSRHPNYLGEIVFVWGLWLLALPAAGWWTVCAPLLMSLLLRYVSGVPAVEDHLRRTRPGYAAYQDQVPMLVPRLSALFKRQRPA